MKKIVVLLSIAFALSAYAQQNAPQANVQKPQIDVQSKIQLMKQFDKDGDGRLNAEERKAAIEAIKNKSVNLDGLRQKHVDDIMNKFDKDGDGKLDKAELSAFLDAQRKMLEERRRRMGPRRLPKEIIAEFDKDGDGKLNTEERKAMFKHAREKREALIKKYDTDGDGVLNDSERDKLIEDPEVKKQMRHMFSRPMGR